MNPSTKLSRLTTLFMMSTFFACTDSNAPSDLADADVANDPTDVVYPVFKDVTTEIGIDFVHYNGATVEKFFPEIMSGGGAFLDYDNDGDLDVLLIQSGHLNSTTRTLLDKGKLGMRSRLYRNELVPGGLLRFTDVSDQSGLDEIFYANGVATGDIDNDGDTDVYITNLTTNALFVNLGNGRFERANSGVTDDKQGWTTSASFLDYDNDGFLDLFLARYVIVDLKNSRRCSGTSGLRDYCSPEVFRPLDDLLLKGNGPGNGWGNGRGDGQLFFNIVEDWRNQNVAPKTGLGVISDDFNRDGLVDIYVANDKKANHLWLNQGDGQFEEAALLHGAAFNVDGKEEASMGIASGDFDADGDMDIFITHLKSESNTLYVNNGRGVFSDQTVRAKLSAPSLPSTGFGTGWFDADNDGDLDLFVANGAVIIEADQLGASKFPYTQPNQLFINIGNGKFVDASAETGFTPQPEQVSRGAAFGDVDNDGDIDILVANNGGHARLMLNQLKSDNFWLSVKLVGTRSNRDASGAYLVIINDDSTEMWRRVGSDGSYQSANDIRVHFGLGPTPAIKSIKVIWPNGDIEYFEINNHNTLVTLTQDTGSTTLNPVN